ncbi:hypothetical protein E4U59_001707 [Claviceps monticola]|nr:hypothetical protein E4U59_001707 [Claviceps monticola]
MDPHENAAMAMKTLRRGSDDHSQQKSHITKPPQNLEAERVKRTSDWVEQQSRQVWLPDIHESGTSEKVESEKVEFEKVESEKVEAETDF